MRIRQALPPADRQGWRRDGWDRFAGGWLLDVGVHAARALRELFGEVAAVRRRSLCRTPSVAEAARSPARPAAAAGDPPPRLRPPTPHPLPGPDSEEDPGRPCKRRWAPRLGARRHRPGPARTLAMRRTGARALLSFGGKAPWARRVRRG